MLRVVALVHEVERSPGVPDKKLIGLYATRAEAEAPVASYRRLEGFQDYPESFRIEEHEVDRDNWVNGFARRDGQDVAL